MVFPRVRTRLDADEGVAALDIGDHPPRAREVRIERRGMIVPPVHVPAGGVRLPDLEQGVRHRPVVLVETRPETMMRSPEARRRAAA
jgi:hypothetical protein